MLKIRRGQLRSLAPLRYENVFSQLHLQHVLIPYSGHYRPHVANFRDFHHSLQKRGVDLSRVSISKSYAILAGIEGYTKTKRKMHSIHEKLSEVKNKINPIHRHDDQTQEKENFQPDQPALHEKP